MKLSALEPGRFVMKLNKTIPNHITSKQRTTLDQRLRRSADVVQILYKCFVFAVTEQQNDLKSRFLINSLSSKL